jgi:hypothetical protein
MVCAEVLIGDYEELNSTIPHNETINNVRKYLCPYLSIWQPNVDGNLNNAKSKVTLFVKAEKAITELGKTYDIEFKSSNTTIVINGSPIINLTIDGEAKPLTIECKGTFENDVFITATAKGGFDVLGKLIIKANAVRYKTIIQPVEVVFSSQENLNVITIPNDPLFKELEKKFNYNSFNQAYIYGELAYQTKKIIVNKKDFMDKGHLFELNGFMYVKKKKKDDDSTKDFNKLIESKYTYALTKMRTGNPAELEIQIKRQEQKLLETFDKEFDYKLGKDIAYAQKKHQEKIVTKAWSHPNVQAEYSHYVKLKQQYSQTGGILPLNKQNTIHLFYSRDIHGGGDNTTTQTDSSGEMVIDTVHAYSAPGTGVCYIFDSGLRASDNITTILHELGHSLGLQHTFEESLGKYENRINDIRYKEDIEAEIKELENKLEKIDEPRPLLIGINCNHIYNTIKKSIEAKLTESYFLQ